MRNTIERPRGITLYCLDLSDIPAEALSTYQQVDVDEKPWTEFHVGFEPWAAVEHHGHLYAISVEGVGYEITDENHLEIELYGHRDNSFGILPAMSADLSPDEVRKRMGSPVDLADLIRVFGQRVEDNFWLWYRLLGGRA